MNKTTSGDRTLAEDVSASSSFVDGSDIYHDEETASQSSTGGESEEKLNVAKRETLAVFRLRLLVVAVLLLAALAVSLIVYIVTDQAEQDEYKHQFDAASKKVLESFMDIFSSKLQAISSLGVALTANGEDQDGEWPFMTISRFHHRASNARSQSGALLLHVNPMVTHDERGDWENYVVSNQSQWIEEGLHYQKHVDMFHFGDQKEEDITHILEGVDSWPIWTMDELGIPTPDAPSDYYMPTWQSSPVFHGGADMNQNFLKADAGEWLNASFASKSVVVGDFFAAEAGDISSDNDATALYSLMLSVDRQWLFHYLSDPLSHVFFPIFDSLDEGRQPVAVLVAWIHWKSYFRKILPKSHHGVIVVLHNTCSGSFTYVLDGPLAEPVGSGDLHDTQFNHMKRSASIETLDGIKDGTKNGLPLNKDHCMVGIDVYPSTKFYQTYNTYTPVIMTISVATIFVFTVLMFFLYDRLVERRQALVMAKAIQSNTLVASLFPANVRDRLMQQSGGSDAKNKEGAFGVAQSRRLKGYLNGNEQSGSDSDSPIADLFPRCTVLFADIAGFTAWSSTRSPEQVFLLLQSVYQAFDKIAKRRGVFKVETIGDSYLAVCGLPEPHPDHAIVMSKFASECLQRMHVVCRELESSLGPDTGDLSMRFGLHSGPVTAGVLKGDRARFQLFGDTVNTASRMESNGERGKIQVSQTTADLLMEAGKESWLTPRTEKVAAKGKGMLQTYWLDPSKGQRGSSTAGPGSEGDLVPSESNDPLDRAQKNTRLIEWMVELLMEDVKKIVNIRRQSGLKEASTELVYCPPDGKTCLDEVKTSIQMAEFDAKKSSLAAGDASKVKVDPVVVDELRSYVGIIASMYRDNPFHSFEHACHVTMSVNKLLKRIVAPELSSKDLANLKKNPNNLASRLHDSTHGITSDPLAVLAITFSALIHDVDHRGVSNGQLAVENESLRIKYSNKSLAEQNSLDIAWIVLMQDRFDTLRRCLFTSQSELLRFRQIVVNMVLATDIFDKELNGLRKSRWEKAFHTEDASEIDSNLRATIVIEHIIQASDVSHTMQHWHIYQKWNKSLFLEMHRAYREGRMAKNPAEFWYKGEIGFFDNYIIPLAKKLKECGVFGVSSDEYLNYAIQNRLEWEERGMQVVEGLVEEAERDAAEGHGVWKFVEC